MTPATIDSYGGIKINKGAVRNPQSQQDADHHNRMAEDTAQLTRTAYKTIVSFATISSPGTVSVIDNRTTWGSGALYYPTLARSSAGVYTVTYAATYTDGLDETESVSLLFAHAQVAGSTFAHPQCTITSGTIITVRLFDAAGSPTDVGGGATVSVWAA